MMLPLRFTLLPLLMCLMMQGCQRVGANRSSSWCAAAAGEVYTKPRWFIMADIGEARTELTAACHTLMKTDDDSEIFEEPVPASCGFGGACPPPLWPPQWALNRSTAMFAANGSGLFDPVLAAKFGLTVFDWSDAGSAWRRGGNKSNCEPIYPLTNCTLRFAPPVSDLVLSQTLARSCCYGSAAISRPSAVAPAALRIGMRNLPWSG